jgi:hypothetical protein
MAKYDGIQMTTSYAPTVMLGGWNNISCTLNNMVLNNFDYPTVQFESPQLGIISLVNNSGVYYENIRVPIGASNYPKIEGNISVYNGPDKIAWESVSFYTNYTIVYSSPTISLNGEDFELGTDIELYAYGGQVDYSFAIFVDVYKDDDFQTRGYFIKLGESYSFSWDVDGFGEYYFEIRYLDPFQSLEKMIYSEIFVHENTSESNTTDIPDIPDVNPPENLLSSLPVIIALITVPTTGAVISSKSIKSRKKHKTTKQ